MFISRVVIRNFRSFELLDVPLGSGATCVIGENNSGKSNFLHAIRLCIDANLSSSYRSLIPKDINSNIDLAYANHVLVALEIEDFKGKVNEEALVGGWQTKPGEARIIYRYRPKLAIREGLEAEDLENGTLTSGDYHWELTAGGDPAVDPAKLKWNEDIGTAVRFSDLQSFLVFFLPALRDVESDLRQNQSSPLSRLIEAMEIDEAEQDALVDALKEANKKIGAAKTVSNIADAIDTSFEAITGPAFKLDVGLGLSEPSFQAIVRTMRVLLTNTAMTNFDPSSNGLGMNNILFVSIWIEYFNRRLKQGKTAGQIILFEEPEAHLHPQLQLTLYKALEDLPFQSILTTHSTHITANAGLESYVVLTPTDDGIVGAVPAQDAALDDEDVQDLKRYLDATRSNLLYARKVMLVEGPAELFLIPAMLKKVKGIDLERHGVSVIPIYGVHFDVYAKLFAAEALPKKCAVVGDGDLKPSDANPSLAGEDALPAPVALASLEGDFVKVFTCVTTFERAITQTGALKMLAAAAADIGAPTIAKKLRIGLKQIEDGDLKGDDKEVVLKPLRDAVLNTAKRFGKARFAQIAARHVDKLESLPKYLDEAADWLIEE